MYDKIKEEIVKALKEKDTLRLQTLRGVKGEADLEHINKKVDITDDLMLSVISHQIKTRRESIVEFEKGNREDLINKTNDEINILQSFLPAQLSEEEVTKILDEAFNKVNPTGAKDMGLIMKEVTPKLKGKADMGKVSAMIKERLSNL